MHVVWKGILSVERLSIPVGLALARKRDELSLRTIHADCGRPLQQRYVCPEHGEVPAADVAHGVELTPGEFAPVEREELAAELEPGGQRVIAVTRFVDPDEVDPLVLDRGYYLSPASQFLSAAPAYALLATALGESAAAGLGSIAFRRSRVGCLLRATDGVLVLHTLFAADELRSRAEIVDELAGVRVLRGQVRLAQRLIRRLRGPLELDAPLPNGSRQQRAALTAKLAGKAAWTPGLEDALRASLEQAPGARR